MAASASHLGFYDLMNIAEQNIEETERRSKSQQFASFTPSVPKKLNPKQKQLSENVQKFLAKKEEEKRLQQEKIRQKREHLLALRAQDKKATKRVGQMLRMTKSASKVVVSDAINCLSDSLAEQGDYQPDEDDYGYVSKHAEELHRKMMEKYKAIPVSKPVQRTKTDIEVPEVRSLKTNKPSSQNGSSHSRANIEPDTCDKPQMKAKQVKKALPPPLQFADLLELAEKKCKEPVVLKKFKPDKDEEKFEFGRPMTAKEKKQYLQEKAIRERISVPDFDTRTSLSWPKDRNNNKAKANPAAVTMKIPKKTGASVESTPRPSLVTAQNQNSVRKAQLASKPLQVPASKAPSVVPSLPASSSRTYSTGSNMVIPPLPSTSNHISTKPKAVSSLQAEPSAASYRSKSTASSSMPPPGRRVEVKQEKKSATRGPPALANRNSLPPFKQSSSRELEKVKIKKEKVEADEDIHISHIMPAVKIKTEPQRDRPSPTKRPLHTEAPPVRIKQEPGVDPPRTRPLEKSSKYPSTSSSRNVGGPPPAKSKYGGRQVIDSDEEEYDSEMDDFIDDSDINGGNISDIIRRITGYDKNRYQDNGSDDECMESSAYEQMREESRSLRIGIKEDLEDMRLEQEEKQRKAEMMKKKRKK